MMGMVWCTGGGSSEVYFGLVSHRMSVKTLTKPLKTALQNPNIVVRNCKLTVGSRS
jgi:hypothetical protein